MQAIQEIQTAKKKEAFAPTSRLQSERQNRQRQRQQSQSQYSHLSLAEATSVINEPAFDRLESSIQSFCLTQLIKFLRLKTASKETIVKELLGDNGFRKIYTLMNNSKATDVRKLAGRLICEATFESSINQEFICDLIGLEPLSGKISLNQSLPPLIKQKLAQDHDFLLSLRGEVSDLTGENSKRYWSFPDFREIFIQTLPLEPVHHYSNSEEISRSLSPSRRNLAQIKQETMVEYLNFPDPQLYLVGFKYTPEIMMQSKKKKVNTDLEIVSAKYKADRVHSKESTSSSQAANVSHSETTNKPIFGQISIQNRQRQNREALHLKTTTESTESHGSQKSSQQRFNYMRPTSASEQRARSKTFQKVNPGTQEVPKAAFKVGGKDIHKHKTMRFKNTNTLTGSRQSMKRSFIVAQNQTSSHSRGSSVDNNDFLPSDFVTPLKQPIQSSDLSQPNSDIKGIIKRLNKPEMLLLNHLQNQLKQYYPQRMNRHLYKPGDPQYAENDNKNKNHTFHETIEKQRKQFSEDKKMQQLISGQYGKSWEKASVIRDKQSSSKKAQQNVQTIDLSRSQVKKRQSSIDSQLKPKKQESHNLAEVSQIDVPANSRNRANDLKRGSTSITRTSMSVNSTKSNKSGGSNTKELLYTPVRQIKRSQAQYAGQTTYQQVLEKMKSKLSGKKPKKNLQQQPQSVLENV